MLGSRLIRVRVEAKSVRVEAIKSLRVEAKKKLALVTMFSSTFFGLFLLKLVLTILTLIIE